MSPQATATLEQVKAAEETIKLATTIEKFVMQSKAVEKSNKRLTCFIIILSIIQTISGVIALLK